jgi:peptide/nickel transport system substrate-binding protein
MVRSNAWVLRALGVGIAAAMTLAACGGSTTPSASAGGSAGQSASPSSGPKAGGTIYILTQADQFDQVDPQRVYTGEDLAFFGGTVMRSLEAYKFSPDAAEGTSLTPDLATDLGTASDGGKTWAFTLRDGVTFQDGSPITCADIAYGVSRTFAIDVINQGPTYAIAYLDIATDADGSSSYKGPYTGVGQELFDKAVTCSADGKTVTFHLNKPVADFNYTTTLGFSPVPKAADTGETYGTVAPFIMASGPYMVESYTTGNGGKMILVRNPKWDPASDPYRKAYPDKWEVDFGIDPAVLDQRLIQSTGNDQFGIQYGNIQPENLAVVFKDQETPADQFTGRAVSGFDPYSRYYWIDVTKVKNPKIRQAMAVALDREALRLNIGGAFAGDFADGFVKPNIGADYAPTGFWTASGPFGKAVPDKGDPTLAKQLITDSGESAPKLTFDFADTPAGGRNAAIVIASLGLAGFTVTPNPIPPGSYYSTVFTSGHEFGTGGWGADWPNASTVIPPLFTVKGGWDLSHVDDPAFNAKVDAAATELDRTKQETLWQALNKEATEQVYAIPTFFGLSQTIAGTKVGPIYRWSAYGSWPYGAMYVLP